MTQSQFEPEVLALLDEIARSPEGRLLHVPRERLKAYYGDPRETITPHGSFLSKAERHLITAYREQAARVLLEACILKLKRAPQIYTTIEGDERVLQARAEALSRRLSDEPDLGNTMSTFAGGGELSFTELAAVSLRLAPCDLAFSALANCYMQERWFRSSLRVLHRFHAGGVSSERRAQGFSNMAQVYSLQGDYRQAFEFGSRAIRLAEGRSRFATWCMTDAIQGGDEPSVLWSAKHLDQSLDEECLLILPMIRQDKERGSWAPTIPSRQLSLRIRSTLSPLAGAVCELFC